MRQTLFRIALDAPWSGWVPDADGIPKLGACWLWLILCAGWLVYQAIRRNQVALRDSGNYVLGAGGILVLSFVHRVPVIPPVVPVFGYGMMVMIGFLSALMFAQSRARAVGIDPNMVIDSAIWLLIFGVVGGRLAYLWQYWGEVVKPGMPVTEILFRMVNLAQGGLVLLGALVGGGLGAWFYAYRYGKMSVWEFFDLLMPAVFIGVGFGRIGCLLNGCCFGDRCDLPWAITFPAGSVTFDIILQRGFLPMDATATMPLHPTQIYSSLDGLLLAFVTATYYWYRRHPGDVFALGCILYSITRFFIELLRADEMGQLGTGLTISQLYVLGIAVMGIGVLLTGPMRGPARRPGQSLPTPATNP